MKFKFKHALLAFAAFAMAGGVGAGVALTNTVQVTEANATSVSIGDGTYTQRYTTGFENATTSTTYNTTKTYTSSDCEGASWTAYYGTVSADVKITGNKSMQMRWYASATDKLPNVRTTSKIDNVKAFKFNYIVGNTNVHFDVLYSSDGTNWTTYESNVTPSGTTKTAYAAELDSNIATFFLKISVSSEGTAPSSGNYKFTVDDFVFGGVDEVITANLESITATTTQTEVYQGDDLDTNAITVTGHYDDSIDRPLTSGWVATCDTSTVANGVAITVTYTDEDSHEFVNTNSLTINVIQYPCEINVSVTTFTEISGTSYQDKTHTYSSLTDLTGGRTASTIIHAYHIAANEAGLTANATNASGAGAYLANTTSVPGRILRITASFSATGRNVTSMYGAFDSEATSASTKIGDGKSTTQNQVFDFSDQNFNYFYFDLSATTGACYFSLLIEYGDLMPEIVSDITSATIYTSGVTSVVANLSYNYFVSVEDVSVSSSKTGIIPVANCVLSPDNATLTITQNGVAGSSDITIAAMDSDTNVYETTIAVTVVNNTASLSSIAVTTLPKTTYREGDALDLTDIVVTATFSDESTDDTVAASCVYTPAEGTLLTPSNTEVTVSFTYAGDSNSTTFPLTVTPLTVYEKVTDEATIYAGMKVVLAYTTGSKAAGNVASEIMPSVNATIVGTSLTSHDAVELVVGGTAGAWTLTSENGALGATAVKKLAWDSGTTTWGISISGGNVTLASTNSSFGTMRYNSDSPRFTTYASGQQNIQLYAAAPEDNVYGFISSYLKMGDTGMVGEGTGLCSSEGLYLAAKAALNDLAPAEIAAFQGDTDSKYTDALARYNAWAVYCNDAAPFDGNDTVVTPLRAANVQGFFTESSNKISAIAVISLVGLTAIGGCFLLRKRKRA